jgi:arylsulfatase A-like enzyme/tetratricopeptide (TPR) repeat protein
MSSPRLAGLALASAVAAFGSCRLSRTLTFEGAPVVLISIDTLRADHLPAYGYAGVQTPAIDGLRRDSILYENAYAHAPLTLPSHVSVLTGLLPTGHGVRDNLGYRLDARTHPTLATLLKAHGYGTGAAVSAFVLRAATGLGDSFDFYDDHIAAGGQGALGEVQRPGAETARRLLEWRKGQERGKAFLFLHLYEPHAPYEPPPPFAGRFASAYDGEIAAADAVVGSFLDRLREDGLYDRAIVVLFSDHGEGLMEHGERHHGILLYRWALHVPLLVKLPRGERAGTRVGTPVGLVDVLPTLARLLNLEVPPGVDGRSFLDEGAAPRRLYAETYYPRIHLGWSELRSLVDERYQLIDGPRPELFDIVQDPKERHDLASAEGRTARGMREEIARHPAGFAPPLPVDPAVRERLLALGYLGGATATPGGGPLPNPRDLIEEVEDVEAAFRLTKGKDDEAVVAFRRLLAKNPRQLDVQLGLAEALSRLERFVEAADAYRAALALAPAMSGEIGIELARVSLLLGRMDDVEKHARAGLGVNPAQAHELLAWAALARNDTAAAESEVRAARELEPGATGSALALAEVHTRRAELGQALLVLEDARARAGAAVRGLDFARGDVLARLGRNADAAAAFEAEIAAFPGNAEAYARLAIVYAIEGRTRREVGRVLDTMHAANPGRETALLAAKTLASIGDASQAAEWRRRAGPHAGGSRPGAR